MALRAALDRFFSSRRFWGDTTYGFGTCGTYCRELKPRTLL